MAIKTNIIIPIMMMGNMLDSVSFGSIFSRTPKMLAEALALCLIMFLAILFIFYYIGGRTFWSSLAGASLIALIVLVVSYPPLILIAEKPSWKCVLYGVLICIFVFILFLYIIASIIKDKRAFQECTTSKAHHTAHHETAQCSSTTSYV